MGRNEPTGISVLLPASLQYCARGARCGAGSRVVSQFAFRMTSFLTVTGITFLASNLSANLKPCCHPRRCISTFASQITRSRPHLRVLPQTLAFFQQRPIHIDWLVAIQ